MERKVTKAPRVKQACLANLETGARGGCPGTAAPPGRKATSETQGLKAETVPQEHQGPRVTAASRDLLDPRDEQWMWGSEEQGRRAKRGTPGTPVRTVRRVPGVTPAPPACQERGASRVPVAPLAHGVTPGTEARQERRGSVAHRGWTAAMGWKGNPGPQGPPG